MESFAMNFAGMMLALIVVTALAWVALRLLRDRLQGRSGASPAADDSLRLTRSLALGAKERVVIVEHGGQRWLLGVSAGGISLLKELPASADDLPVIAANSEKSGSS